MTDIEAMYVRIVYGAQPDDGECYVIDWCHAIGATVHVRGTDERPVIVIMDKASKRELGGIEVRRRMEAALQ